MICQCPHTTNLTTSQWQALNELHNDTTTIILICNKELGPNIIDRQAYIDSVLNQHLQNKTGTYLRIPPTDTSNLSTSIMAQLDNIITGNLPEAGATYFADILRSCKFRTLNSTEYPKYTKVTPLHPFVPSSANVTISLELYLPT